MNERDRTASGLGQWLGERLPIAAVIRWSTDEDIPGGARFFYTLGSVVLFLFGLEVVTGLWQMMYYVPTVDHAYASVMYLRLRVPLGWLVHGLHYWGANAFIAVLGLHAVRVFIWGSYKKPRELVWIIGVMLLLLASAASLSGAILPWDMRGYWAGEVATSIVGTATGIGGFLEALLRGGASMGQGTLSRSFVAHVGFLPALMLLFVSLHLAAFRTFGSAGSWNPDAAGTTSPFWPDQVFKDTVVIAMVFFLLVCLSAFRPPPIGGPADPLDGSFVPRPEWNFLFLYEILKAFRGPLERIGTVGVPLAIIVVLFSAPFIDRGEARSPLRRLRIMAAGLIVIGGIVAATIIGSLSSRAESAGPVHPAGRAPVDPALPRAGDPPPLRPEGAAPAAQPGDSLGRGRALFTSAGCIACHTLGSTGGASGPNLSDEARRGRSREWLRVQILHPERHNPGTRMPAARGITSDGVDDIIDLLLQGPPSGGREHGASPTAREAAAAPKQLAVRPFLLFPGTAENPTAGSPGSIAAGLDVYRGECAPCHGVSGTGDGPASLSFAGKAKVSDLTAPVMAAYSDGALYALVSGGRGEMPAFRSLLSDTQMWQVIDYVRTLGPGRPASRPTPRPAAAPDTQRSERPAPTPPASPRERATAAQAPSPESSISASVGRGEMLFTALGCIACHRMNGRGGTAGPDLSNEGQSGRSRSWLEVQIARSVAHDPGTLMPAYPDLPRADVDDIVMYLLASRPEVPSARPAEHYGGGAPYLPSPAVDMIGDPRRGGVLYDMTCRSCHGEGGRGGVPNPGSSTGAVPTLAPISRALFSADPAVFAARIDPVLQRGATPAGSGPELRMPAFGATRSLTQEQIANIEAYILKLNGVNRARIVNPGVSPGRFVAGAAGLFALALVLAVLLWARARKDAS
jgi:ubiquinol-cytochrome c reductase cytochrome b subunit